MKKVLLYAMALLLIGSSSCSSDGDEFYPGISLTVKIQTSEGYKTDGVVYLFNLDESNVQDYTPQFTSAVPHLLDANGESVSATKMDTYSKSGSISGYNTCIFILDYNKTGTVFLPKGNYLVLVTEDSDNPMLLTCGRYSYKIVSLTENTQLEKIWSSDIPDEAATFEEWQ